jgi:hypothetical protein
MSEPGLVASVSVMRMVGGNVLESGFVLTVGSRLPDFGFGLRESRPVIQNEQAFQR